MTEQVKRQLIKALAYNPEENRNVLKENLNITDDEIDSVTGEEVMAERNYYIEMGYLHWKKNWLMSALGMETLIGTKYTNQGSNMLWFVQALV